MRRARGLAKTRLRGAVARSGRRAGFGLCGRLRRRRGGRRRGSGPVQSRSILAFLEKHGDHRVDGNALAPFGHHDLTDGPLFDSLDFHRRLVGFDLRDDIAGGDLVAFLDMPFGERAFGHRR
jgi:hypothetical protein